MSNKYSKYNISVILPTYNEKENLPIMIYMLMKTSQEKWVHYWLYCEMDY